ncbi:MAG: 4Fe-4S dicluster domain-containing protein [Chloroflexi bacterium]|nr:4Fe-4S dicluster domain-containing protein [Chloroflexota bacterium]
MSQFREHIRAAIANPVLQAALDANAERRVAGRIRAFASLPDHAARRQRARAVRAEVIANLDEVLGQFIAKTEANGIVVHRARDANEAIRIVQNIIGAIGQSPRPKLIAKSKSMVSEEIGLNEALEAAGQRVVETDLGEYIVQLRGEKPSHIITPAVHLRRQEVAQLFHEKLNIPYTEDIPVLTETARQTLREVFLSANVGISGVNFGVAETGSLCIVTNEGNGRMVTTLPPIHIALMGMERLVRSTDDLALMLSLLPRSATGQKISVYTQLIHAPRRVNDPDGPRERHLILLDNGRARLRTSPLEEALYCIRCGACLNACPVFREIGGHAYVGADGRAATYPGPIGSVISPGLFGPNFAHLAQACSLCGACKEACPVDIDLPKLLLRVRSGQLPVNSGQSRAGGAGLPLWVKFGLTAYRRIATRPRLFAVMQKMSAVLGGSMAPADKWIHLPAITGWGYSKDFPRPAGRPFRERFQRRDAGQTITAKKETAKVVGKTENTLPQKALVEQFCEELRALGGQVYLAKKSDLAGQLVSIIKVRGIRQVQADEPSAAILADLKESGLLVQREPNPEIRAGVTLAAAGIAETGTILVTGGEGRPLTASLLPEIHLAILHIRDIHPDLSKVLNLREVAEASSAALISGPSRTADIEMTLTIGVHGPKELHVFLVDD